MPDLVGQLSKLVSQRMRALGFNQLNQRTVRNLLEITYLATLRSEEGRFVRGSITYSNPDQPDISPPMLRRADYPSFTAFGHNKNLNLQTLVKLARAVDQWTGSIAVYTDDKGELVAWGVIDQMVQLNVRLNNESRTGFQNPGLLLVTMDGIGEISAYHRDAFLGAIRGQILVRREEDGLRSRPISTYVAKHLNPYATAMARLFDEPISAGLFKEELVETWATTISRLCIGVRQRNTGGAFLLTPQPILDMLQVSNGLPYERLRNAAIISTLDEKYRWDLEDRIADTTEAVERELVAELSLAQADADDRQTQLTGAIKLVASLASVDGLVLMTPNLGVLGFGAKIGSGGQVGDVFDGTGLSSVRVAMRPLDVSNYGTRHTSIFRYCSCDPEALAVIVSQDGQVRLVATVANKLFLWENVKLTRHGDFSKKWATRQRDLRKRKIKFSGPTSFGYTKMPKSIENLLAGELQDES